VALLCLLGVKSVLLCVHLLYQFFDPIKCRLIGDPGRQAAVMLDLAVEFDTLVAHFQFRIARGSSHWLFLYDGEPPYLFILAT
jgi:hypothetical protein